MQATKIRAIRLLINNMVQDIGIPTVIYSINVYVYVCIYERMLPKYL